jgi:tryptophan synthase alpha chain
MNQKLNQNQGLKMERKVEVQSYNDMFQRVKAKKEGAFIPFVVAGDPDFETSLQIVKTFVDNGADALEIGFPFSDPVADGPTVQAADIRALSGGMTTDKCFQFIQKIRKFSSIPMGLLVYYNLIYNMGVDQFYKKAQKCGVNGVLAADLPPEEAEEAFKAADKYNIHPIFMAAQNTSNERLSEIVKICSGFLYVVAIMGITGARKNLKTSTFNLIERVKKRSNLPIAVGFGVSSPEQVQEIINSGSDGVIVASAILDIITENLENKKVMLEKIADFCQELKNATRIRNQEL